MNKLFQITNVSVINNNIKCIQKFNLIKIKIPVFLPVFNLKTTLLYIFRYKLLQIICCII